MWLIPNQYTLEKKLTNQVASYQLMDYQSARLEAHACSTAIAGHCNITNISGMYTKQQEAANLIAFTLHPG